VSAMTAKTAMTAAMIEIRGPHDGKFIAQFTAADGRSLEIHVPVEQASVLRDIQEGMPYASPCTTWSRSRPKRSERHRTMIRDPDVTAERASRASLRNAVFPTR
jgi:hypothetical protein